MPKQQQPSDLGELLDRIEAAAAEGDPITLGAILDAVGRRSFGPVLLLAGLITVVPVIGDIPGVPLLMGALVLLTAAQLLLRREHFWLPNWLLHRAISRGKLCKGLGWLRGPARFVDRWSRPRLVVFTHGAGAYVIALACIAIALAMPVMEVVPFTANGAGAALAAFGLALIAHDGAVALGALAITGVTFAAVLYHL